MSTSAGKDLSGGSTLKSYPNPAKEYAKISFELRGIGNASVNIYDLNGRLVKSLCNEKLSAGIHEFTWMLDENGGSRVSKGVYLCKLDSFNFITRLKL